MERLITPDEAASQLGITKAALGQLRYLGTGPEYQRLSPRRIRYTQDAIDAFVASTRETSTDNMVRIRGSRGSRD